jgi:hypothetical protein
MARHPPYDIEKAPERVDFPESEPDTDGCGCPWGEGPYPDEGEADPTLVKQFDKWNLWQCSTCSGIWWQHNARADYGDPRL